MLRRLLSRYAISRNRQRNRLQRRQLFIETLEERRVLATFVVTNLSDGAGPPSGSLRAAIEASEANQAPTPSNLRPCRG